MFKGVIPETVKLREAPSHGISIFQYDSNGIWAKTYRELIALKRSKLGDNRLAQGIFSNTEPEEESLIKNQEPSIKNDDSWLMVKKKKIISDFHLN